MLTVGFVMILICAGLLALFGAWIIYCAGKIDL